MNALHLKRIDGGLLFVDGPRPLRSNRDGVWLWLLVGWNETIVTVSYWSVANERFERLCCPASSSWWWDRERPERSLQIFLKQAGTPPELRAMAASVEWASVAA